MVGRLAALAALCAVVVALQTGGAAAQAGAAATERARSADAFVDSVGVNVHIGYNNTAYSDFPGVKRALQDLGVRHVRDRAYSASDWQGQDPADNRYDPANPGACKVYCRHRELAAVGVRTNYIVDPRWEGMGTVTPDLMRYVRGKAGDAMESVEGPNEYDISPCAKRVNPTCDWAGELRDYQRQLYDATKGNASTSGVPVLAPSLAHARNAGAVGSLCAPDGSACAADHANMHSYTGGYLPSDVRPDGYDRLSREWMAAARELVPDASKRIMATETGYHNAVNQPPGDGQKPVPEPAAGKYTTRLAFEYFNRPSIERTYFYELLDQRPDNGDVAVDPDGKSLNEQEKNWGLLRNDFSPKPAYTGLKNTLALLEDPGPAFAPGSLDYSLTGDTTGVHRTLLQKRGGAFYLVLWQEVVSDGAPVAERPLTVDPGVSVDRVTVYRPNFSSAPVNTYPAPDKVNVSVPDYPVILEIDPAADTAPPVVTGVTPANGATVGPGANVTASFSEDLDPASVDASTVRLERKTPTGAWVSVAASVAYDAANKRAVLNPTNDLTPSRAHRATVTTGVRDAAGNALAAAKVWGFQTR